MAAHLAGAGAVAARTMLPVIGVSLASGGFSGVDGLYATVWMPSGIPAATVAIDGAKNAAFPVCKILVIRDETMALRLEASCQATRLKLSRSSDNIKKRSEGKED